MRIILTLGYMLMRRVKYQSNILYSFKEIYLTSSMNEIEFYWSSIPARFLSIKLGFKPRVDRFVEGLDPIRARHL